MEQPNYNPIPGSNPKKNILLWLLVIFAALAVVFFSASYVKKFVEKNKAEKQNQQAGQMELESQTTQQENALDSVTAPTQSESVSSGSQPAIDQTVVDSVTVPQANTSTQQEESPIPVVDQEILNSLSAPAKK